MSPPSRPARVMVVDDSPVTRAALVRLLATDPAIRVVAEAADGHAALALLEPSRADLVLLDVAMPALDGLATLPLLLCAVPDLAVVMLSALTTRGAETTLRALRLGAADYLAKPAADMLAGENFRCELIGKVLAIAPRRRLGHGIGPTAPPAALPTGPPPRLVVVGSSTGGPLALFTLIEAIGRDLPVPVVVAQHMPASFTPILAAHLDQLGVLPCREAAQDDVLRPGHLYLAAGGRHLLVERAGAGLRACLSDAAPENFCRPSVDLLFRSAAEACGGRVLAVMLTGMGHDGLAGTRAIVAAGGAAIAQDEATSVVWGMPGAVAQAGLCRAVLPLGALGGFARRFVLGPPSRPGPP